VKWLCCAELYGAGQRSEGDGDVAYKGDGGGGLFCGIGNALRAHRDR